MPYDIINNLSKLIQNSTDMDRHLQFEFLKEIADSKMRILDGLATFLQLSGYIARICMIGKKTVARWFISLIIYQLMY